MMRRSPMPPRQKPLARTSFRRDGQAAWGSAATPSRRIRPRSKKRARQEREYARLRGEFLAEHPVCEWPGCGQRATTVQHRRRRNGARLLDVEWWAASCWAHNMRAEDEPALAREVGFSVPVNGRSGGVA